MTESTRASQSPDTPDFEYHEPQQRRSSFGDYDPSTEPPEIWKFHAYHLREKLSEVIESGRIRRSFLNQYELYTQIQIEESGRWPWEPGFPAMTPTPPEERTDMLTPTPPGRIEEEAEEVLGQENKKSLDQRCGVILGRESGEFLGQKSGEFLTQRIEETPAQRVEPLWRVVLPENWPRRRVLRGKQSSMKGESRGIKKRQNLQKKHSMVTRSRCRGRCCRGKGACSSGG